MNTKKGQVEAVFLNYLEYANYKYKTKRHDDKCK